MKTIALHIVLNNWTDYDNLKLKLSKDARTFDPDEQWELNYLTAKIKNTFPNMQEHLIIEAIQTIASSGKEDRQRKIFVSRVLEQLTLAV